MPNFFVAASIRGTDYGQIPEGVTWKYVAPGKASSRATAIEELSASMTREVPVGAIAYALVGDSSTVLGPACLVTLVTIEFLAILMDEDPKYWPLVAKIVLDLGIDPDLIEQRGGAALLPPILIDKRIVCGNGNAFIDQWFAFHGYVVETRAGTMIKYRSAVADPHRWPSVKIYSLSLSGTKTSETIPAEVVNSRLDASPVFILYNFIEDFTIAWGTCSAHTNIYPCLPYYFDMAKNVNVMYPRFVPCEMPLDKVPIVHPGPALYSPISAPHAANAAFFDIEAENNAFLLVRESRHKNPVLECPLDIVTIK
jgi:hypothetical protein